MPTPLRPTFHVQSKEWFSFWSSNSIVEQIVACDENQFDSRFLA
jgi:hypothetical protein